MNFDNKPLTTLIVCICHQNQFSMASINIAFNIHPPSFSFVIHRLTQLERTKIDAKYHKSIIVGREIPPNLVTNRVISSFYGVIYVNIPNKV